MQFPNRCDSAIQSDTNKQAAQRELHAKLLSTCHGSTSRSPPRGPPWGLRGLAAVPVRGGRARTRTHARLEAVAEPAGPGRGAGGWRQGLAGLRDDAPGHTPATRRRRCGGRRRDRRARAGFEIDHSEPQARVWRSRGRPGPPAPETPAAPQAPQAGRPPRGLRGLAAVPEGGGRARAGLEIDRSERSSRVAISRAGRRPPAHTAARPIQTGHAAAGDQAGPQPQQAAPRAAAAQ